MDYWEGGEDCGMDLHKTSGFLETLALNPLDKDRGLSLSND